MSLPPSQCIIPSAVYSVLCIINSFFPLFLLLLDSSLVLFSPRTSRTRLHRAKRVAVSLTPTWFIFYCLEFNTFLKIPPHTHTSNIQSHRKKTVACLFQVSVSVRWREMTGGRNSPSVLSTGDRRIIRERSSGGECVCLSVDGRELHVR